MVNLVEGTFDHQIILYDLKLLEFDLMTGFIRHQDGYFLVPKSIDKQLIRTRNYSYVEYRKIHNYDSGCISMINKNTIELKCFKCPTKLPFSDWYQKESLNQKGN